MPDRYRPLTRRYSPNQTTHNTESEHARRRQGTDRQAGKDPAGSGSSEVVMADRGDRVPRGVQPTARGRPAPVGVGGLGGTRMA